MLQTTECVRAEIVGDDTAVALGLTVRSTSPVLALCRALIAAGHDPALALQAFRGDTLCLTVRSIAQGARLQVNTAGTGFTPYRIHAPSAASPMRQTGAAATGVPPFLAEAAP